MTRERFASNWLDRLTTAVQNTTALLRGDAIRRLLNPGKDIEVECGYPTNPNIADYKKMYEREGYGTRVVDVLPEEAWETVPDVYETEDKVETEFEKAFKVLVDNPKAPLWSCLERADKVSGIGSYGGLLIGIGTGKLSQAVDGINPTTGEVVGTSQTQDLLYLKPLGEAELTIKEKETDTTSPRFGMPKTYTVTFEEDNQKGREVHWTRIIHLADNRTTNDVIGTPRMKPVYNRLLDVRKVLAGSAEMFWRGGYPGFSFEVHPDMADVTMDADSIKDEMEAYSRGLQRYFAMEGVVAKSMQPQVANPTPHLEIQLKLIALTLGMPYRVFLGTEAAELASSQDRKAWMGRVSRRQERYLEPMIIRPTIYRLMACGVLPFVEGYTLDWPDRNAPTDLEVADVASKITDAIAKYVASGADSFMAPYEYMTMVLGMTDEEATAVVEAVEKMQSQEDAMTDDNMLDDGEEGEEQ